MSSGNGEGAYPAWGRDEAGKLLLWFLYVRLAMDLQFPVSYWMTKRINGGEPLSHWLNT